MEQLRGDKNICSRIKIEHRGYKCSRKEIAVAQRIKM
jgi:hypothetical protein